MAYSLPSIAVTGQTIEATWGNRVRETLQYFKGVGGVTVELEAPLRPWNRSTTQRNTLAASAGATVYNQTLKQLEFWNGAKWVGSPYIVRRITQAAYDGLGAKDADTMYLVIG